MATTTALSIILVAALVAGCADQPGDEDAAGESGTSRTLTSGAPPTPAPGQAENASVVKGNSTSDTAVNMPAAFSFSECNGVASSFRWPGSTGPSSHPEGWESDQPLFTMNLVKVTECQRITWGKFDRPMDVVLDIHDSFRAPDSCRTGNFDLTLMLHGIWVSDAEFGQWLQQTYGLPVHIGDVTNTTAVTGNSALRTWSWGEPASSLQVNILPAAEDPAGNDYRLFWETPDGVGYISYIETFNLNAADNYAHEGHMEPPMLYATKGPNPYVGVGELHDAADVAGEIFRFKDNTCTEPW